MLSLLMDNVLRCVAVCWCIYLFHSLIWVILYSNLLLCNTGFLQITDPLYITYLQWSTFLYILYTTAIPLPLQFSLFTPIICFLFHSPAASNKGCFTLTLLSHTSALKERQHKRTVHNSCVISFEMMFSTFCVTN